MITCIKMNKMIKITQIFKSFYSNDITAGIYLLNYSVSIELDRFKF